MNGADFIEPLSLERSIDGRDLVITPMTIGMLPKVLGLVEPLLAEIGVMLSGGVFDRLADGAPDGNDMIDLAALLAHHGDELLAAVALLARTDAEWVNGLLPDRAVALMADVIRVNADFFRRAIQSLTASPTLASLATALGRTETPPA